MKAESRAEDVAVAEDYYDSDDADRFYFNIWGGEDIHVGLYKTPDEPIPPASRRTVETMAEMMGPAGKGGSIIDLGAGYGGSARYLVTEGGAKKVVCVNISETQNRINREKNKAAGLDDKIEVLHGSFDDVPAKDESFDVVWSQDSFLHGADREQIIKECERVLKPGGRVIFTDILQTPDAPADKLQPVYDRIHLSSLGSIDFYDQAAEKAGLVPGPKKELAEMLPRHYGRVREELMARREELKGIVSDEYADRMIAGLGAWVDGGNSGWLSWGILTYDKP
ncbi:class I SAM-dependent methyltransferase [Henriciella aquimarina]|uniref:class I SAM-dependent methyltransferase n=1 Tax=Henriciella aquimarina TaxID=545261 RepID=UPI00146F24F6|nr:class I SAM-dependent methyltransferase [Henriciella aquimarina]